MATSIVKKIWSIQNKLPRLEKNKEGFKFKYVELGEIIEEVTPHLVDEELGYRHSTEVNDRGDNIIKTTIFEINGTDSIFSSLRIPEGVTLGGMNGYQSLGSALTYFRRYTLLVMLGILTGEDVDVVKPQEKKTQKLEGDNYVSKIQALIKLKRKRPQLEAYFEHHADKMTDAEIKEVTELINAVK